MHETARGLTLSLLNLGLGDDPRNAVRALLREAVVAEELGFKRLWLGEHYVKRVAWASPIPLLGVVAAATATLRIGTGALVLAQHDPYAVADAASLLATVYRDRIDLGVARARGHDRPNAVRSTLDFDTLCTMLQGALAVAPDDEPGLGTVPSVRSTIPLWICGSSVASALLAARLGTGYVNSSFAPGAETDAAIAAYREQFVPREPLSRPQAAVAFSAIVSEELRYARHLHDRGYGSALRQFYGTPAMCWDEIASLAERLGVDEVFVSILNDLDGDRMNALRALGALARSPRPEVVSAR
jgi:luciferase family oxidoreductase group 1